MPKKITVPDTEFWDEEKERFYVVKGATITIEHSLVSISKWESKYKKPFLHTEMNRQELLDYIRFMTINPTNLCDLFYEGLSSTIVKEIQDYINDSMTATWFNERRPSQRPVKKEIITSELVYYWMIKCGIPFDPAEKWHFNRLMTLIRVYNVQEGAGDKRNKMSKQDIYKHNRELNARRRAMNNTGD